eukprot:347628-Chlamydomonas_euryale.AAC.4
MLPVRAGWVHAERAAACSVLSALTCYRCGHASATQMLRDAEAQAQHPAAHSRLVSVSEGGGMPHAPPRSWAGVGMAGGGG